QLGAPGRHHFDDYVELAGSDHDVVRLRPLGDLVRDDTRRSRGLDADERLLEAEPERVRNADDLEDPLARQPPVPRADGSFRDTDSSGNRAERLAAVALQRLDYPL